LKNFIIITAVSLVAVLLLFFIGYKLFFDRQKFPGEEALVFAFISEEDNMEDIEQIFLIDISEKSCQLIIFPENIECSLPGLSRMEFSRLYPFGGSSIIPDAVYDRFGIRPGYYFTAYTPYLNDLIEEVSPLTLDFEDDISFDDYSFNAGDNILQKQDILSLIHYDYDTDYEEEFLDNNSYILGEVFNRAKGKSIDLLDVSSDHVISTNLDREKSENINKIFRDTGSNFFLYATDSDPGAEEVRKVREMVMANDYHDNRPQGLVRFYPEIIEEPLKEEIAEVEEEEEPEIQKDELIIQSLNGNFIPGSATMTAERIEELGYIVSEIGNVEDGTTYENTIIYYRDGLEEFAYEIGQRIEVESDYIQVFGEGNQDDVDITIIVGLDYKEEQ